MANSCTGNAPSEGLSNLRIERSPDINWRDTRTAAQCLSHLCLSEHLSDITFTFSAYRDVKLPAHKFVLSMRSAVFEAMFYGSLSEGGKIVTIKDIEPEVMKTVLKFVYDDGPKINGDNVLPCLYTAQKYNLSGLVKQCSVFLENNIDVNNVCQVHEHAVFYEMKHLQERCLAFIVNNATSVFSSPGFLSLSQVTLLNVLKSEELASEEIDVFTAAIRWAAHKCEVNKKSKIGQNMREQLGEALFQIRFPNIPIEEFAHFVTPSGILTSEEIVMLYQFYATKGSSTLEKFRQGERQSAEITLNVGQYKLSPQQMSDHCNSQTMIRSSGYQSNSQPIVRSSGARLYQQQMVRNFGCYLNLSIQPNYLYQPQVKQVKLKSVTGTFIRNVTGIVTNGGTKADYKRNGDKLIFLNPIDISGNISIRFF